MAVLVVCLDLLKPQGAAFLFRYIILRNTDRATRQNQILHQPPNNRVLAGKSCDGLGKYLRTRGRG
jgi:hypothetical protein